MTVLLGAIADDFTGATDLCNTLVRRGMRAVQLIDVPEPGTEIAEAEAVVVALKSRTIPAADAIDKSLAALAWLQNAGARQILFKYCSTFDSTDQGNIGPVAEALMEALGTDFTLFCPAFPEAGRTIYRGYLFVGDVLLSESGMRDHPLTPMRDPSLVRVLQRQCRGQVGLVPEYDVARGPVAIRDAFSSLRQADFRHAIVDAIEDRHLEAIGEAAADFPLITGGSGIALGLPENFRRQGLLGDDAAAMRCRQLRARPWCCRVRARKRPVPRSPICASAPRSSRSTRSRRRGATSPRKRSPGRRRGSAIGRS